MLMQSIKRQSAKRQFAKKVEGLFTHVDKDIITWNLTHKILDIILANYLFVVRLSADRRGIKKTSSRLNVSNNIWTFKIDN